MPTILPTFSKTASSYNISLTIGQVQLRTYFNTTSSTWYIDISQDDEVIASGLALLQGLNIIGFSDELVRTIGQLWIIGTNDEENDTQDSLGDTHSLVYYIPGEFETLYPDYLKQDFRAQQFVFDDLFTFV